VRVCRQLRETPGGGLTVTVALPRASTEHDESGRDPRGSQTQSSRSAAGRTEPLPNLLGPRFISRLASL
jgi:hypothetical protein